MKKTLQEVTRKRVLWPIGLVAGAIILFVVGSQALNAPQRALARDSHIVAIATLQDSLGKFDYISSENTECGSKSIIERSCTMINHILLADRDVSQEKISNYLRENGWFNSSWPEKKEYFVQSSSSNAVITATANVTRHFNEPKMRGGAITSRIAIIESRELPPADGVNFRSTGFMYSDQSVFHAVQDKKAEKYYLVTLQTDYSQYLW